MLLYELMTLKYPFYDYDSPIQVSDAITSGKEPYLSEDQQIQWAGILPLWRKCIAFSADDRPTAVELRSELERLSSTLSKQRYHRQGSESHLLKEDPVITTPRRDQATAES
jgi:serine/threonine protein kinase